MFHNVLVNRFDEWIVGNSLNEDRPIVVLRRGRYIDLQRETSIALEHSVVNVLNGFEPGHLWVVNVVGFVVKDSEFVDLAN